jgi:peptidyl-prolyl cis-trans isomerase C
MYSTKHLLLAAVLAVATLPVAAADKNVAATVNGKPIYENDVTQYTATPNGPSRDQVIAELVNQELVYQDAVKSGLDKKPDVQRELEQLRRRVLMSAAVQAAMSKNPVTDEQVKAEYEKNKGQLAHKEYKARHILVDSKEKADKLIADLNDGAKFAELATKNSSDSSAKSGGDLGWFAAEQMVPPFAAAVRSLQKGEYTKTPVQTQFGWHVIMLEDTRDMPAPTFDEIKDRIHGALQKQRVAQYLEGLRKNAKVDIKKP